MQRQVLSAAHSTGFAHRINLIRPFGRHALRALQQRRGQRRAQTRTQKPAPPCSPTRLLIPSVCPRWRGEGAGHETERTAVPCARPVPDTAVGRAVRRRYAPATGARAFGALRLIAREKFWRPAGRTQSLDSEVGMFRVRPSAAAAVVPPAPSRSFRVLCLYARCWWSTAGCDSVFIFLLHYGEDGVLTSYCGYSNWKRHL